MFTTESSTAEAGTTASSPGIATRHTPWYRAWQHPPTRPAVDLDDPLGGALEDAAVLVAFTAQSRRNFQREKLVSLTKATHAVVDKRAKSIPPTTDELGSFWAAYDDLAAAAAPANAQSIRATIAFGEKRFPGSLFSATSANGLIALVAFFACVALQGFWSAGRDLLERVDKLAAEKATMETRIQNNHAVHLRAEERYMQLRSRLCEQKNCGGDRPSAITPGSLPPLPRTPLERNEETRIRAEAQLAYLDYMDKGASANELDAQRNQIIVNSLELEHSVLKWSDNSYLVCRRLPGVCPIKPDEPRHLAEAATRTAFTPSPDALVASNSPSYLPTVATGTVVATEPSAAGDSARVFRDTLQQIRVNLRSIGDYWIPMFMGLLGAMTFILRALTIQLREFAYVPRSVSVSVIRICLGAVAGVFGALLSPTTEGALKALPPLFVPFVFGYGIEILFSLMDNVVTSFTQGESADARAKVLG